MRRDAGRPTSRAARICLSIAFDYVEDGTNVLAMLVGTNDDVALAVGIIAPVWNARILKLLSA